MHKFVCTIKLQTIDISNKDHNKLLLYFHNARLTKGIYSWLNCSLQLLIAVRSQGTKKSEFK